VVEGDGTEARGWKIYGKAIQANRTNRSLNSIIIKHLMREEEKKREKPINSSTEPCSLLSAFAESFSLETSRHWREEILRFFFNNSGN
jgi:hypothetical protein